MLFDCSVGHNYSPFIQPAEAYSGTFREDSRLGKVREQSAVEDV